MKILIHFIGLILSVFLLVNGCGYTQPYRTPPIVPRGNVIQVFPSQYFVESLDTTEKQEKFIIIDTIVTVDVDPMYTAWNRDADAYLNVNDRAYGRHDRISADPYGHIQKIFFPRIMVKYLKNIIPCDSPVVSFTFSKCFWVSATVAKYRGDMIFKFEDEKIEYFEWATQELEPGIYEIHIRAGENPLWTHRGLQWETSRWIEIVR